MWTHIDPNTKQLRNPHELNTGIEHNSHAHSEISALIKNIGNLTTKTVNMMREANTTTIIYKLQLDN